VRERDPVRAIAPDQEPDLLEPVVLREGPRAGRVTGHQPDDPHQSAVEAGARGHELAAAETGAPLDPRGGRVAVLDLGGRHQVVRAVGADQAGGRQHAEVERRRAGRHAGRPRPGGDQLRRVGRDSRRVVDRPEPPRPRREVELLGVEMRGLAVAASDPGAAGVAEEAVPADLHI
jgi:hypothetical protein